MSKYYSAEEMANFRDNLDLLFSSYKEKASSLISSLKAYRDNETYKGVDAIASKEMINSVEIKLVKSQIDMHKKFFGIYNHMMEAFSEKVDDALNARIDLETLDEVERDMKGFYFDLDRLGNEFERITDNLRVRHGHVADFTKPNFNPAREAFRAFCGGDDIEVGFLHNLKQAFINFDKNECDYMDRLALSDDIDIENEKIDNINSALSGLIVAKPTINVAMLKMITKSSGKSSKQKYFDKMDESLITLYHFSPAEIEYLKKRRPDLLKQLYVTSQYDSKSANVIYGNIKRILYGRGKGIDVNADGGIDYGNYHFSSENIELLKNLEQGTYGLDYIGCGVYDKEGNLIGIYPHYVGDGGITFGYGHYINADEYKNDKSEKKIVDTYLKKEQLVFDVDECRAIDDAKWMPIDTATNLYYADVDVHIQKVTEFLDENDISLSNDQVWALVMYRYNCGSISSKCQELLLEGNMDKEDWKKVWHANGDRLEAYENLMFGEES